MFYLKSFVFAFVFLFCHLVSAGPLHEAIENGDVEKVQELLEQGADPNAKDEIIKWTPLRQVFRYYFQIPFEDKEKIARLLVAAGADVNAKDKWGTAILHNTIEITYKKPEVLEQKIRLLIDIGVDVNIQDRFGKTALHYTFKKLSGPILVTIAGLLKEAGADMHLGDWIETPMDMAKEKLSPSDLENLLKIKAKPPFSHLNQKN